MGTSPSDPLDDTSFILLVAGGAALGLLVLVILYTVCTAVVRLVHLYRPQEGRRRRRQADEESGGIELGSAAPPPPPPAARPPVQRPRPAGENPFASPFDHDQDDSPPPQYAEPRKFT